MIRRHHFAFAFLLAASLLLALVGAHAVLPLSKFQNTYEEGAKELQVAREHIVMIRLAIDGKDVTEIIAQAAEITDVLNKDLPLQITLLEAGIDSLFKGSVFPIKLLSDVEKNEFLAIVATYDPEMAKSILERGEVSDVELGELLLKSVKAVRNGGDVLLVELSNKQPDVVESQRAELLRHMGRLDILVADFVLLVQRSGAG